MMIDEMPPRERRRRNGPEISPLDAARMVGAMPPEELQESRPKWGWRDCIWFALAMLLLLAIIALMVWVQVGPALTAALDPAPITVCGGCVDMTGVLD